MKILTFGELLLRLEAPAGNRLFQKDYLNLSFCGAEANVAVSLANFGKNVFYLTVVPNNEVGKAALQSLNYFGVDTSKGILSDKGRMGLLYLERGASQRPSKVIYDRQFSAISFSTIDDYDFDKIFEDVKWLHLTGITPALSDSLKEVCLRACEHAHKKGITISCDLNFRSKLWNSEKASKVMNSIMKFVDVCIGNEEDAERVLNINSYNEDIIDKYSSIAKQITKEYGTKVVAFSLRNSVNANINKWRGFLYQNDKSFLSKEYEIYIVDRVGGGDSFAAGIICGLIDGMSSQDIIEFATAASCLKHTIEGDFSRFTKDEVSSLMNSDGNGRIKR